MDKKFLVTIFLISVALVTMGQSSSCTVPMDATGDYSGSWTFYVKDNGTIIDAIDCPLGMTLEQDVTLDHPDNFSVNGTIHVDFSCFEDAPNWPEWAKIPEPSDINVKGTMEKNGKLVLASGGCGPGTCIILALNGQGEVTEINSEYNETGGKYTQNNFVITKAEDIPSMNKYSGEWGLAIGVAFLGSAGDNGTFEVFRDE